MSVAAEGAGRTEIVVIGAGGRLGRTVVEAALSHAAPSLGVRVVTRAPLGHPSVVELRSLEAALADVEAGARGSTVVIDASTAGATAEHAATCARFGAPLVCATTGVTAADERALDDAARVVPVLHAANLSLSAHVAALVAAEASARLPGYDVEVVELHHRKKKDAPSGTALMLAESVRAARRTGVVVRGRDGLAPRAEGDIGVAAVRGGDVVGEHTVHLLGEGERIEIVHRISDRAVFGRGAVIAARFLVGKPPGRYGMADVLAET